MLSQGTLHFLSHILPYSTLCVSLHHLFSIYLSIIQIRLSFHGPKRVWRLSPAVSLIFLNIYLFACLHQGLLLSLCHVCVYPSAYCTNCPIHKTSVAYCTELKGVQGHHQESNCSRLFSLCQGPGQVSLSMFFIPLWHSWYQNSLHLLH